MIGEALIYACADNIARQADHANNGRVRVTGAGGRSAEAGAGDGDNLLFSPLEPMAGRRSPSGPYVCGICRESRSDYLILWIK